MKTRSNLEKFLDECIMFHSNDSDIRLIGLVTWFELIAIIATVVTQIKFNKQDMGEFHYVFALVCIGIAIGFVAAVLISIWSKRK